MSTKKASAAPSATAKDDLSPTPGAKKSRSRKTEQAATLPSLPDAALNDIIAPEDRWFSPKVIAAILGVDEKWLSSLREGLKGVEGPPYKKLGEGRSAPIRYNYGEFKKWLDEFPHLINTHGKVVSRFVSAGAFFSGTDLNGSWLFAQNGDELEDIVIAINKGLFDGENEPEVCWLTFWEWLQRAANSQSMGKVIKKAIGTVREDALARYEAACFEQEAKPGKKAKRKLIDD
ncbi:hypothetical protein [Curvibacter delicatus]|uniref:hypothetical protein n=1 Tax=Curvibacter delicatus TaxID=80879 RepID=UPI00082EFB9C|nr:hypothetical protein [Curvibacter delicatus]